MSLIKVDGQVSTDHVSVNPAPQTTIRTVTDQDMSNKPINAQIVSDSVNDRVLLGTQEDGFGTGKDFGFKVSQEGYDVKTCTDDQLVMSSAFNSFKIVASGTINFSTNGTDTVQVFDTVHGLGYTPSFVIHMKYGSTYYNFPVFSAQIGSTNVEINELFEVYVDSSKISIRYYAKYPYAYSYSAKYYLMKETAN